MSGRRILVSSFELIFFFFNGGQREEKSMVIEREVEFVPITDAQLGAQYSLNCIN